MNVYPSACTSQGLLKDREGLSEDFTDIPLVNTHVHADRSDIHTLSAHMPPLTLMADSLVGTKNNTHTHRHTQGRTEQGISHDSSSFCKIKRKPRFRDKCYFFSASSVSPFPLILCVYIVVIVSFSLSCSLSIFLLSDFLIYGFFKFRQFLSSLDIFPQSPGSRD